MNLDPGPELDALVAEKVTQWKCPDLLNPSSMEDLLEIHYSACRKDHAPPYSTSIEAAWEVVEEMARRGMWFNLQAHMTGCKNAHAVTFHWNKPEPSPFSWGDSTPHAICLAALKAVGAV